jgi:protoporphyrinogen oxidase
MLRGGGEDWAALAGRLDWSNVACLNLGVARPSIADGAHWIYFPDDDVPFYRAGFPSNFSSGVAPRGMSSMYIEFGLRRDEQFDPTRLETAAIEALQREGVLDPGDRIPVRDWTLIDPGYVIFDRERQEVMRRCVPALEAQGVHLIGRYGAWTYSYMERALLDGLELAHRLREVPVG